MRCGKKKRGSVILLVVGLLTILAMLGSALLISSHLDAKQSRALAQHAPADPIADGIVAQLKQILRRDLHIAADGPYDGIGDPNARPWNDAEPSEDWNDVRGWKAYVDVPRAPETADDIVDPWLVDHWLASNDLNDNPSPGEWSYSHISDLTGELTAAQTTRPRFRFNVRADGSREWFLMTDPDGDGPGSYADDATRRPVDTDGDDHPDALLVDSGVVNAEGQRYYFAVRVTDLSGKINVNTAAQSAPPTLQTSPVNVELELFLGAVGNQEYALLDGARAAGSPNLDDFFTESASRLFDPYTASGNDYLPFAIGEEAYLLWLSDNMSSPGRLPNLDADLREHLTTFGVTRNVVRDPDATTWTQLFIDVPVFVDLTDESARQAVYVRMLSMVQTLSLTGGVDEEMAAHFVANLWAYQGGDIDEAYSFTPQGETFTVYGLQPELRITEAFAMHSRNSMPGSDDYSYAYAIELTNFTGEVVNLDEYQLVDKTGAYVDLPSHSLAIEEKVVLYNWDSGGNNSNDENDLFFPANIDGKWIFLPAVDFSGPQPVLRLVRKAGLGGTIKIPVDQVSAGDLSYTCADKTDPGTDETPGANIRRDDDPARSRYNVAAYEPNSGFASVNQLGSANDEVTATDLLTPVVSFSVPIIHANQDIQDIGELSLIYLTGPINTGVSGTANDLAPFTTRIESVGVFADSPGRGRLDLHPLTVPAGGYNSGQYPDIPAGALWGEFFALLPADDTRESTNTTRIYGRININTASREVLAQLPWPTDIVRDTNGDGVLDSLTPIENLDADYDTFAEVVQDIVDYVLAYRDRTQIGNSPDYSTRSNVSITTDTNTYTRTVTNLRDGSTITGFLAAGEIAVPLADFVRYELLENVADSTHLNDQLIRDSLYRPISNLITVNSDVCAANIRVDVYDPDETPEGGAEPQHSWYYVAVIDRSNCMGPGDTPAVLMFSEVK